MKPRIDPNKWYCSNSIPCIKKAKDKYEICSYAKGTKEVNGTMRCGRIEYKYIKCIQGFWLLMKIVQSNENNT